MQTDPLCLEQSRPTQSDMAASQINITHLQLNKRAMTFWEFDFHLSIYHALIYTQKRNAANR